MKILITHPVHPGQFGALANALAGEGHEVVFLCQIGAMSDVPYRVLHYKLSRSPTPLGHPHLLAPERAVLNGQAAARATLALKSGGYIPDLVIGHSGFGELAFLPDTIPSTPIIAYAEYYYRSFGTDVGFDPALAVTEDEFPRIRLKNALTLASMEIATAAYAPTQWQRDTFPTPYRDKIHVIHDGVDTNMLRPNPSASLRLANGRVVTRDTPFITFAARSLEHYRGFHKFWPALVRVLDRNPNCEALVVGGDETAYGPPNERNDSLRNVMIQSHPTDLSRVHFFDSLDRNSYISMLQLSHCHVYLTYPFIPSWSLVEAMSIEAPLVVSNVAPVLEIVGRNTCRLEDFFDTDGLAGAMEDLIRQPDAAVKMRKYARKRAVRMFDFKRKSWPQLYKLIQDVAG